jgi:hypothetical protein
MVLLGRKKMTFLAHMGSLMGHLSTLKINGIILKLVLNLGSFLLYIFSNFIDFLSNLKKEKKKKKENREMYIRLLTLVVGNVP